MAPLRLLIPRNKPVGYLHWQLASALTPVTTSDYVRFSYYFLKKTAENHE